MEAEQASQKESGTEKERRREKAHPRAGQARGKERAQQDEWTEAG